MPKLKNKGFTLIELITVLLIISILAVISYPLYTQHIIEARRDNAKSTLLDLSSRMENYYLANSSYEAATLQELGVEEFTEDKGYRLAINSANFNAYQLSATPTAVQNDPTCGALMLNEVGEKTINGTGNADHCW